MKRFLMLAVLAAGCDAPTRGEVYNTYVDDTVVYKVWFQTTLFPDALLPGERSVQERLVPSEDFAFALLAPGWDPTSASPPATLMVVKTSAKSTIDRGGVLVLELNHETVDGDCRHGKSLSQDDADLITQRIFPGPFTGSTYDAKTCVVTPAP